MDEVFEGLPGITPLVDDIIISGKTREEHDTNLRAALDRATSKNLRLNPDKLTVGTDEVEFFGHLITADGLKPDPTKVKAIQDMPSPTDKKELQTFLGMTTYLSKFAPHLSDATKPMRDLLKQDAEFVWDHQQEAALQKVKKIISSQPVLSFFDTRKEVTLEVDASKSGLGAAIFQDGKPIAFASKSLTPTEENYAQIEKELYAILFGCRRFHQYIYGRPVHVRTDHKPLESIAKKPLVATPPRLQRMLLQLQKYDLIITHVPGKSIPVADTLSRKFLPAGPEDDTADLDTHIHTVLKNLPVSDQKMDEIRTAIERDPQSTHILIYIQQGWPESRQLCHPLTAELWNHRDELSTMGGLIFKGQKIFIPTALRPAILSKIHTGHLGIEKTKQRAREILFWPGMSSQIHDLVSKCPICAPKAHSNPKEPLLPHPIPSRPWQKVASDLFAWNNRNFLVTVDYYSRFFEIDELLSTTTSAVIKKLASHFARHGIPEQLITDNGPQFASEEFAAFANTWDFNHTTSSPGYPQSNGLAEKTVQTAKRILSKCSADGSNPLLALLEYRTTPVDDLASPAELLMGRQLRSILPSTQQLLMPKTVRPEFVIERRQQRQDAQSRYYNRGAHPLPPLKIGEHVGVQLSKGDDWKPATVIDTGTTPRSMTVETQDGGQYRRNRRFLRPFANTKPPAVITPPAATKTPAAADQPPPPVAKRPPASPPSNRVTTRSGRQVKPPCKLDI